MPPLPLDQQLCFALYGASMAVGRAYKPALDRLGLTYPQFLVLQAIEEQDGRGITAIATRLGLELSTITPLVRRLEAAGLVTRERHPGDDRQVRLHLTEAGRARWANCGCLAEVMLSRSGLSVPDLRALCAQVAALRDALSAAVD
nr:MarR family transcriptional regulator [Endobacter medicaginis]